MPRAGRVCHQRPEAPSTGCSPRHPVGPRPLAGDNALKRRALIEALEKVKSNPAQRHDRLQHVPARHRAAHAAGRPQVPR